MRDLSLVETYRRVHPGQGTSNVFYCFDKCFSSFCGSMIPTPL